MKPLQRLWRTGIFQRCHSDDYSTLYLDDSLMPTRQSPPG